MAVQRRRLTVVDRTIIELRLRDGWSIRSVARELGRSAGTVSAEIKRHGDAAGYLAERAAAQAAFSRSLSGRKPRLASDGPPFAEIARLLRLGWSPEQMRWSRSVGQFDGLVKLGPGYRQAANLINSPIPYASSGVWPPSPEWGLLAL